MRNFGTGQGQLTLEDINAYRLMNLDSHNKQRHLPIVDTKHRYTNLDSAGSVFFSTQLQYLIAESFNVLYPELPARTLFPTTNEAGAGKRTITYTVFDKVGKAKLIGDMAGDLPRADVDGRQVTMPVKTLGISVGYDVREIKASQFGTGEPLDQQRMNAANRAIEEAINNIAFFGNGVIGSANGLPGLFNNTYIGRGSVAQGGSGNTAWATKTADEILADINGTLSAINANSNLVERANFIALPPSQYNYIESTRSSTTSASDTTILQYVVNNSQFIPSAANIMPINELVGAVIPLNASVPGGITGNDTDDVMYVFDRDPRKLQLHIPVELTYLPVQERNLSFLVPGYADISGLNVYFPGSMYFAGGI